MDERLMSFVSVYIWCGVLVYLVSQHDLTSRTTAIETALLVVASVASWPLIVAERAIKGAFTLFRYILSKF